MKINKENFIKNFLEKKKELFNKYNVFFAFNDEQFKKNIKKFNINDESNLRRITGGAILPKENVKLFVDELNILIDEKIKNDIKFNGIEKIIIRELHNHEATYTYSIEDTSYALKGYNISDEKIKEILQKILKNK